MVDTKKEVEFAPIETWENKNTHRDYTINIQTKEFTSVCPMTGLPDFGTIIVDYIPDEKVIELKAFKYYLLSYRNFGMFYENVVNKILDDIVEAIDPRYVEITGKFTPRGGISTWVKSNYRKEGFEGRANAPVQVSGRPAKV